jgi:hypothetical protein
VQFGHHLVEVSVLEVDSQAARGAPSKLSPVAA